MSENLLNDNTGREARQLLYVIVVGAMSLVTSGLVLNASYPGIYDPLKYRVILAIIGIVIVLVLSNSKQLFERFVYPCFHIYAYSAFALIAWTTASSHNHPIWVMGWYLTAMAVNVVNTRVKGVFAFTVYSTLLTLFLNGSVDHSLTPLPWMFSLLYSAAGLTYFGLRHRLLLIEELHELNKKITLQSQQLDIERARTFNASKLAAIGEVSGGIAHEINNPLTVMQGLVFLIKKQLEQPAIDKDKIYVSCERLEKTTYRIAKIISGIRNFARDGSGDPFVVKDIFAILNDSLEFFREKLKLSGINIEITGDEGPIEIECQEVRISQLLVNILSNARYAAHQSEEKWIKINFLNQQSALRIEISNSGDRINPAVEEKLFQPFFTTKGVGEGTGLGLSISKGIVSDHNGAIFHRQDATHTTFVIELPKHLP